MLIQLYVKDFVLIDNVNLEFAGHMSAFTGETGAGKSLLIDAIGILRGDRINASMVKQGKDKAVIEGVFVIPKDHISRTLLAEAGYDLEDDMLIIQREFTKDGKSSARLNHRTTTVSFIKSIFSTLIDIHSQHDAQYLLNTKYHLSLLDSYCHQDALLEKVKKYYHDYQKIQNDLTAALQNDYNEDDLEFLTYQLNEIDEADLKEHELEELEQEQRRFMAFEKISTNLHQIVELLNGEQGASPALYEACRHLEMLQEDETFTQAHEKLMELYYALEDQYTLLHDYLEGMEYDELSANEVNERIFLYHKILRKYGNSVSAVLKKRAELEEKIDVILHRSDYVKKQEQRMKEAYDVFYQHAQKLSVIRQKQAAALEKQIVQQLKDVQLVNARFHVEFQAIEGSAQGIDKVQFLISMNKGESMKPLSTTASGGELSRLMLALKTIFTKLAGIETIIFDEIDTGVSGSVAFAIGKKMQELAKETQVFCVTHLAQVAACAHQQYLVVKEQKEQTTTTDIRLLEEAQRIQQLALISSDSTSAHALEAAKELYTKAQAE